MLWTSPWQLHPCVAALSDGVSLCNEEKSEAVPPGGAWRRGLGFSANILVMVLPNDRRMESRALKIGAKLTVTLLLYSTFSPRTKPSRDIKCHSTTVIITIKSIVPNLEESSLCCDFVENRGVDGR